MTIPPHDTLLPLTSDTLIEERVRILIGRAHQRQLWLLFLDRQDVQLPVLIPVDSLPGDPEPSATVAVIGRVLDLMEDIGSHALIIVWERYGSSTLTPQDLAWARSLASACHQARVPLRAMLLSHRSGVRWIAPDDYVE
jgi:hypothetical protein